jgi:hypothetical protein
LYPSPPPMIPRFPRGRHVAPLPQRWFVQLSHAPHRAAHTAELPSSAQKVLKSAPSRVAQKDKSVMSLQIVSAGDGAAVGEVGDSVGTEVGA